MAPFLLYWGRISNHEIGSVREHGQAYFALMNFVCSGLTGNVDITRSLVIWRQRVRI